MRERLLLPTDPVTAIRHAREPGGHRHCYATMTGSDDCWTAPRDVLRGSAENPRNNTAAKYLEAKRAYDSAGGRGRAAGRSTGPVTPLAEVN